MLPSCGYCLDSDCRGFKGYTDPDCPEHGRTKKKRSCNRHDDCDASKNKAIAEGRNPYIICCHDDCCSDCFGS